MSEIWLPSLKTSNPQAGFELALTLARRGVAATQASPEIRGRLRAVYEQDTAQIIHANHVAAVHFQTIAAANNWWRDDTLLSLDPVLLSRLQSALLRNSGRDSPCESRSVGGGDAKADHAEISYDELERL